jgi:hypothetical protein
MRPALSSDRTAVQADGFYPNVGDDRVEAFFIAQVIPQRQ